MSGSDERADVFHPADRRPAVRVRGERVRHQLLVEPAVDVVLDALAALVGDDVALGLDRRRARARGAASARTRARTPSAQVARRQRQPVVRPVDPGRGVRLAAGALDEPIELAGRQALGLAEHQVLEQVRHAGRAGRSWREPTRNQVCSATIGARRSTAAIRPRPLSSRNRRAVTPRPALRLGLEVPRRRH